MSCGSLAPKARSKKMSKWRVDHKSNLDIRSVCVEGLGSAMYSMRSAKGEKCVEAI